jgi:xanthine dehydrogenase YagR molybdenum-binding subunit
MNDDAPAIIGAPLDRVDGAQKVTGAARYAGDFPAAGLCHAAMIQSTVPRGRIVALDTTRAERAPGVRLVLTHHNAIRLPQNGMAAVNPPAGRVLSLLQDDVIHYQGQPIGVVVADTLEQAVAAAAWVRVTYASTNAVLDFSGARASAYAPKKAGRAETDARWGDLAAGLAAADVKVDAVYTTPMETHNPMEPHATLAQWDGDRLTLHDATQGVSGVKQTIAKTFGIPPENVHVISPFLGGGFGCKGSMWSHVALAAMAARKLDRPVRLVLARPQMFGPVGGRPQTEQHVVLGARRDGTLTAIQHDVISHTSEFEDFVEPSALQSRMLYACPNGSTTHRLVKLNVGTPTFQRAPGESSGTFALESAMDELAYELAMDPLELRLRNYADAAAENGLPFSSKALRDCYHDAAARFRWSQRSAAPRSMQEGRNLVGFGMATATYPANRTEAAASATLLPDGSVLVRSGTQDLGTGTYTVMTQVAAGTLGMPVDRVRFELGDTAFPEAPNSGGSTSAASVSPAVQAACEALRNAIVKAAIADPQSPVYARAPDSVQIEEGWLRIAANPALRETVAALAGRRAVPLSERAQAKPGDERSRYAFHSFGAVFVEVNVDRDLGVVRVPRIVATYDVGRLLNAKTAQSQLRGGIVWGVSMALHEHTMLDTRVGRFVNANLADYHVPVNADIQLLDVRFVDLPDPYVNPLGVRGIGEIGITGVAAAIANAVYHATGKRIRALPITVDKLVV